MGNYQTTKQAAVAVGLSTFFLYRKAKVIPAARRCGRALRWDVEALKTWMAEQAKNRDDRRGVSR